ncbi:MAG TPA: transporter [Candidatus Limnocylindria bacterium]|nr:transporter [Candidatus Limnocylindria bacterium]
MSLWINKITKKTIVSFVFFLLATAFCPMWCYHLPPLALGLSNILDGGPLREKFGWYLFGYTRYYHTDKFVNACGQPLGNVPSPAYDTWALSPQVVYQSHTEILHGYLGIAAALPFVFYSHVEPNHLGFKDKGAGIGNFFLGPYIQWQPIKRNERPIFVHRLEFDVSFPIGSNDAPCKTINPGTRFFFIDPYWAATLYLTPKAALSWRLQYLWCATNPRTRIRAGDAIHLNYSAEINPLKNLWIAITGYALRQLKDSRFCKQLLLDSKEQVVAAGPGALYFFSPDNILSSYFYFEKKAKNRPQGMSFVVRFIKHF